MDTYIEFGKYRGYKLKDTPKKYLDWIVQTYVNTPDHRDKPNFIKCAELLMVHGTSHLTSLEEIFERVRVKSEYL